MMHDAYKILAFIEMQASKYEVQNDNPRMVITYSYYLLVLFSTIYVVYH